MFKKLSTVKVMITGMCFLAVQATMANTPMTTCPSIDMLKSFPNSVAHITPITFDEQAHTMIFSSYASKVFGNNDLVFPDYGRVEFTLSGIAWHEDSDMQEATAATLDKMQIDFEAPIRYKPFLNKSLQLLVCTYSSPSGDLKALISQEIKNPFEKEKSFD